MKNLAGRSAVVTGAGTGIGRGIALSLASEGVNVLVADIDESAAAATAADAALTGVGAKPFRVDVASLESVEQLADAAYAEFGSIDILVNNAGVTMRPFRATWDTDYADFQWMMNVNFWGVLHGHHVFVPRMRKTASDKHIVNTASVAAFEYIAGHSAYTVSKVAVEALTIVARKEFRAARQPISASVLYPGAIRTRIATSERLRPETDRSDVRGVRPWSTYLDNGFDTPSAPPDYLEPDVVGPMVVKAIRNDEPYIVTHQVNAEQIKARADALTALRPFFANAASAAGLV